MQVVAIVVSDYAVTHLLFMGAYPVLVLAWFLNSAMSNLVQVQLYCVMFALYVYTLSTGYSFN